MAKQLNLPRALDSNGDPVSGALAYVYQSGTTTPVKVYTDSGLLVAHANPIVANANGYFAQAFYNDIIDLRVVFTTSTDTTLFTFDPVPLFPGVASGASDIPFSPTEQNTATDVQTAIENVSGSTSLATITTNAHTITTSTGSNTSYIVAAPATLTEYAVGQSLLVRFHTACADDPKINADGVGSGFLKRMQQNGTLVNLDAGDVLSNHEYKLVYNGTFWVVVSPISATNEKAGTVKIVEAVSASPSTAWPPTEKAVYDWGPKAWACIRYTGGVPSIARQFNIASVTDNGTGDITIAFTTSPGTADYVVNATMAGATSAGVRGAYEVATDRTSAQFRLQIGSASEVSSQLTDPDILSVVVY